jgi:hypothetical protein
MVQSLSHPPSWDIQDVVSQKKILLTFQNNRQSITFLYKINFKA